MEGRGGGRRREEEGEWNGVCVYVYVGGKEEKGRGGREKEERKEIGRQKRKEERDGGR